MNKRNLLLRLSISSCLLLSLLPLKAEHNDYYKVYYNGEEVKNGESIICSEAYGTEYKGRIVYFYQADINVINQLPYSNLNRADIQYTDQPSYEEWENNKATWGTVSLCYHGGDANGEMASCMGTGGTVRIPSSEMDCFNWEIHLEYVPADVASVYRLYLRTAHGELQWNNYVYDEDSDFYVDILFKKDSADVESLQGDKDEIMFYNLSGMRVNKPEKGFYMMIQGKETKKILFK